MKRNQTNTNNILRITLEYALSNMESKKMDEIITNELNAREKLDVLLNLNDEQIKSILLKIGFKQEFLNTI